MTNGLRKSTVLLIASLLLLFAGATLGHAQTLDTDTVDVGVVVTWECPLLQTPEAGVSNFASMSSVAEFRLAQSDPVTEPPLTGPGSCPNTPTPGPTDTPTETATATATATTSATATSTDSANSTSTVPAVAFLPDTGSSGIEGGNSILLLALAAAGCLMVAGASITHRREVRD